MRRLSHKKYFKIFLFILGGVFLFSATSWAEPAKRLNRRSEGPAATFVQSSQTEMPSTVPDLPRPDLGRNNLRNVISAMRGHKEQKEAVDSGANPVAGFQTNPNNNFNPSAEITGFQAGDEGNSASGGNPRIGNSIVRDSVRKKKGAPDFSTGGSTQEIVDNSLVQAEGPNTALKSAPTVQPQQIQVREDRLRLKNRPRPMRGRDLLKADTGQIGHFQSKNSGFDRSERRRARIMDNLNKLPNMPKTTAMPGQNPTNSDVPIPASQHRQPANLPVPLSTLPAPNANPAPGGNSGSGGGPEHSSSKNTQNSNHGAPLATPLILGLCGHLPISVRRRTLRTMISEISRRFKNGIGFVFAARSPAIIQMAESDFAFVHQAVREGNSQPGFNNHNTGNKLETHRAKPLRLDSAFLGQKRALALLFYINLNYFPKYSLRIQQRSLGLQTQCSPFYLVG